MRYNRKGAQNGMFAGYINKFLQLKQEASGYPAWCVSEEDREKFKRDYYENEGIKLHHVAKNEGRRAFSKIMLNSLWGKLAQRDSLTKVEYISRPSKYFSLVTDATKVVNYVVMLVN